MSFKISCSSRSNIYFGARTLCGTALCALKPSFTLYRFRERSVDKYHSILSSTQEGICVLFLVFAEQELYFALKSCPSIQFSQLSHAHDSSKVSPTRSTMARLSVLRFRFGSLRPRIIKVRLIVS